MAMDLKGLSITELAELRAGIEVQLTLSVAQARRDGLPWQAIAERLGVSRQEAHRRYSWLEKVPPAAPETTTGP